MSAATVSPVDPAVLDAAAASLHRDYDPTYGGFGGAPKFPAPMALLFLLRHYQRTGEPTSLEIVRHTAEAMARGGIYDQLAGGFARYSVDERWLVPHFEKMLYDNALLLRVYTQLWRLTGDPMALRVADRDGPVPGPRPDRRRPSSRRWTPTPTGVEGPRTSGPRPSSSRCSARRTAPGRPTCSRSPSAALRARHSVLRLARDIDDADPEVRARCDRSGRALLAARDRRPQPARDDKVVAAWAGSRSPRWSSSPASPPGAAGRPSRRRAAAWIGRRTSPRCTSSTVGCAGSPATGWSAEPAGVLEDYGCVAEAFCALHQLTGEGRWLDLAGQVLDTALDRFGDAARAASTTPPTMPSSSSPGRPTRPTTERALAGVAPLIGRAA